MKKPYCPECGKQGCYFVYIWPVIFILIGIAITCLAGYKEKAEAEEITICDNCPHIGWFGDPNSCEEYRASLEKAEPSEGDVLIENPNGDYIWVADEPYEPNEIRMEIDCSHRRLESIDGYWAITSTMQTKGSLIHGEYRCLDCGWAITIVSAVSTKPEKTPEPNEPECEGHGVNAIYCPECHSLDYLLEPNEPECKHENAGDIVSICSVYHTDGSYCWHCPDCGEYVNSKEPIKLKFGGDNMTWSIPTWPDYIELEKDFYILPPNQISENWFMGLEKGTKIYFKDD